MTSPIRVLRQVAAWPIERILPATGLHRRVLLLDEPMPVSDEPIVHSVLSEAELFVMLHEGTVEVLQSEECPCCDRHTAHAVRPDGMRRCWTCGTETAGAA